MVSHTRLTTDAINSFSQDGFLILDNILPAGAIPALTQSFEDLFNGRFASGTLPDEVNWQNGRDDPSLTRQICNGWKADRRIARIVLDETLGKALGTLAGWSGVRIMIDNVLWKPAGARSLGYHQDSAFLQWLEPAELMTLWIALDDTSEVGGTIEYVRGSHHWPLLEPDGEFHAPEDYRAPMFSAAAQIQQEAEIVPIVVPAGCGTVHHGNLWHGSGPNLGDQPRRALVLHAMHVDARYVPERFSQGIGPIYSRYRRLADNTLDDNHFPIIWTADGRRSAMLDQWLDAGLTNGSSGFSE